ncbi:recombinase family protein [Acetivibrio cellulolyticus]|uniref:recombinase family protein n=1 Tax=Acetivibrio cellulolyticus TaxID=35830 RepID=UPI0001E2E29B|nr:recombinase family protein [Acetivibrio cellulolyticus]
MEKQIIDITPTRTAFAVKQRVAAYARVPCDKDTMLHSLAAQIDYYRKYIIRNPEWEFVGVYADEAKTGTKEDREQFQKLLSDCRSGLIDMVVTKSISRFARNTVTLLGTVRELKELGINIFFEEQNINSVSEEGELMLTLLASQAQEESLSCSENCKWKIRKGFELGQPNTCTMLGYRLVNGEITLVPDEAKIVKEIFDLYLSGCGVQKIANTLNERGVRTEKIPFWHLDTIRGILRNEKYMGDLLLQKSLSESHLTKRQVKNEGQLQQFYITDDHEPIVSRAVFSEAQREVQRRAEKHKCGAGTKSVFTGKIKCGICGKNYRRKTTPHNTVWCCSTFNTRGKAYCASKVIPENTLKDYISDALGSKYFAEDFFTETVDSIVAEPGNTMRLIFKDGTEKRITWKDRSRSESWTDEMREAVRQKMLERNGAKK